MTSCFLKLLFAAILNLGDRPANSVPVILLAVLCGKGRVGRNENETGVKVILRILVAKLVFGFCRII